MERLGPTPFVARALIALLNFFLFSTFMFVKFAFFGFRRLPVSFSSGFLGFRWELVWSTEVILEIFKSFDSDSC